MSIDSKKDLKSGGQGGRNESIPKTQNPSTGSIDDALSQIGGDAGTTTQPKDQGYVTIDQKPVQKPPVPVVDPNPTINSAAPKAAEPRNFFGRIADRFAGRATEKPRAEGAAPSGLSPAVAEEAPVTGGYVPVAENLDMTGLEPGRTQAIPEQYKPTVASGRPAAQFAEDEKPEPSGKGKPLVIRSTKKRLGEPAAAPDGSQGKPISIKKKTVPEAPATPDRSSKWALVEKARTIEQLADLPMEQALPIAFAYVDLMIAGEIDAEKIRGGAGRVLTEKPDNPAVLVLHGFSELLIPDSNPNVGTTSLRQAEENIGRYMGAGSPLIGKLTASIKSRQAAIDAVPEAPKSAPQDEAPVEVAAETEPAPVAEPAKPTKTRNVKNATWQSLLSAQFGNVLGVDHEFDIIDFIKNSYGEIGFKALKQKNGKAAEEWVRIRNKIFDVGSKGQGNGKIELDDVIGEIQQAMPGILPDDATVYDVFEAIEKAWVSRESEKAGDFDAVAWADEHPQEAADTLVDMFNEAIADNDFKSASSYIRAIEGYEKHTQEQVSRNDDNPFETEARANVTIPNVREILKDAKAGVSRNPGAYIRPDDAASELFPEVASVPKSRTPRGARPSDILGPPLPPVETAQMFDPGLSDARRDRLSAKLASANRMAAEQEAQWTAEEEAALKNERRIIAEAEAAAAAAEAAKPVSHAAQSMAEGVARNREALKFGRFQLRGDKREMTDVPVMANGKPTGRTTKVPVIVHTQPVKDAIEAALRDFGQTNDAESEDRLFEAFRVYRGMGTDRNEQLFRENPDEVKITDQEFILTLEEMRANIIIHKKNHPFAYTNAHHRLGMTECFPTIARAELAEWFTENPTGTSRLDLTKEAFIEYNLQTWKNDVEPRMHDLADTSQYESVCDLAEAALGDLGEQAARAGVEPRSPESRVTLSELYSVTSEVAKQNNDENDLKATGEKIFERTKRAVLKEDKKRKKLKKKEIRQSRKKKKKKGEPLSTDEAMADPDGFLDNMIDVISHPSISGFFKGLVNIARVSKVVAMLPLAITSPIETLEGVFYQGGAVRALKFLEGINEKPTDESMDLITDAVSMEALSEAIKIISAEGFDALIDAVNMGIILDKNHGLNDYRARSKSGKITQLVEGTIEGAMVLTTGEWVARESTAKIFLEFLVYANAHDKAEGLTALTMTPEMIENGLRTNPHDFFKTILQTDAGRAAVRYASDTSLGGIDPLTETVRKMTSNSISDAALGYTVGFFLRFGVKSLMRIVPYSYTMLFMVKKGIINPARWAGGLTMEKLGMAEEGQTAAAIADSNEYMLGGNQNAAVGLSQNVIVDSLRFTTQLATYMLLYAITSALGIEPPDDEDKRHLWYEWKIGGAAIKTNWYTTELLGFGMPFVMAIHAYKESGDIGLSKQIVTHGVISQIEDNPWANALDVLDFINNFDREVINAQTRAEGYMGDDKVSTQEFMQTQAQVWLLKRTYETFEPAFLRQLYNEHGLDKGMPDLAHSPNTIYTDDPNDMDEIDKLPKTDMTTWSDAQMRKAAMPSRLGGFLMNMWTGYYFNDEKEHQRTGYMRDEMPLVSNADPIQQGWIDELTVKDDKGAYVAVDLWTEAQSQERVNTIISLISNPKYTASYLGHNGVVIPYDARKLAAEYLTVQKRAARNSFEKRSAAGEFYPAYDLDKKKASQAAWEQVVKEQDRIQAMIDKLYSEEIPYAAQKYNRTETNFRPMYTWTSGPYEGQPATSWDFRMSRDKVELKMYASGDHKSSLLPWLTVDDQGKDTYDSQTPSAWQLEGVTDDKFLKQNYSGQIAESGMFQGQDKYDVLTGGGNVDPNIATTKWDPRTYLFGARGYRPAAMPFQELEKIDPKNPKLYAGDVKGGEFVDWSLLAKPEAGKGSRVYGGGGWGGGSSYSPKIYSHPAYSINADKPAGLYSKNPAYTRFDYLRPKVTTKGSREAYRREDF